MSGITKLERARRAKIIAESDKLELENQLLEYEIIKQKIAWGEDVAIGIGLFLLFYEVYPYLKGLAEFIGYTPNESEWNFGDAARLPTLDQVQQRIKKMRGETDTGRTDNPGPEVSLWLMMQGAYNGAHDFAQDVLPWSESRWPQTAQTQEGREEIREAVEQLPQAKNKDDPRFFFAVLALSLVFPLRKQIPDILTAIGNIVNAIIPF